MWQTPSMCLSVKYRGLKKRFEEAGDVFDKPRSGRPRNTTAREDRLLARKSKASPFSTAAELHETWSPEVPVSTRTLCRILSQNGLHGRISAQKPALNKRQLENRVAFAKAHSLLKGWTLEKWQKVDFSDESSVELHHSHRKYCRRPTGARMDPRFTQKTVKFGGGKIMVWGYIQKKNQQPSADGRTRKALDHILISQRWKSLVTNCRVYRGAELGNTDHRLLVAQLKLKLRANQHTKTQPHLDSSLLSDPNMATNFSCSIRRTFDALATDKVTDWQTFKESVIQSAHNVLGFSRSSPNKPWISETTLDIIERRREARLRGDLTEYRRLNRQRNMAIAEDREKFWQAEAKHLESAANNNNMSRVFSLLRQARNGPRIKTARYNTTPADPTILMAANAVAPSDACSTDRVTPVEVKAALKKLNNRKAPGICAITAEMLKSGGDSIVEWLTHIFNQGDRLVCGNHRGITLLSIPGKLFTRILLTRALPAIRSSRRPQQAGFMPNRSTIDHISAVRLLIEQTYELRKDRHLYMAFIDLKAAFDTVCHSTLWSILQTLGAPPKIVALFKLLYSNAQSCVRVNGRDSDWFSISSGVRQGCVAAPDLFNCINDHLMSKVCERVPGVPFGSYHLTDLEYADNTILLSTSYSQLRDALDVYSEEAEKLGLYVSWTKTKFMHVGDGPDPPPLRFGDNIVEPVKNFVYLGSTVTDNGDLKPEILSRRALAASALQSLWKPLWRHQTISRKTKLRIYNSAVLSILLYGSETWPLNKTLAARIDGFDSRALRTIENIRWPQRVSNEALRARTRQPRASGLVAQRRTRWFGHVLRLPPDHPTKAIIQFDPRAADWRRPQGKPRTRWLDVVAGDLQQYGVALDDAEQLAQDRQCWKQLVHLVSSTHRDG
ncbi:hypothetical protein QQF64_034817 [Cirrhinus molitorella]|uniref:Reverse transcriptase domain-containing protein n=1 Tax=Cirrhinus molitorella TaxID=172907 RepID=A0ABR3L1Q7_9TELE